MSEREAWAKQARCLLARMLRERGCDKFGAEVALRHGEECACNIVHDRRGAPYVVDETGCEVTNTFVSLSDEGDVSVCVWAEVDPCSPVVGLGVDLVDTADFGEAERGAFLAQALFGKDEARRARELCRGDVPVAYAFAFGAKEAAFKATSQRLRAWCQQHAKGMFFEVRDFALASHGMREEGVRHAVNVFSVLDIDHIELGHARLGDLVLVIALAIGTNAHKNAS